MAYGFNDDKSRVSVFPLAQNSPLPVENGGTGATTLTENGILQGDGANAVNAISTDSGALYATEVDGAASFGTLPIAQGGTGSTTAADAATALNVLPLTGGTLTGDLVIDGGTSNRSLHVEATNFDVDTAPSSMQFMQGLRVMDSEGEEIGHQEWAFETDKSLQHRFACVRQKVNGAFVWRQCAMRVAADGTVSYEINTPSAFLDALGCGTVLYENGSSVTVANNTGTALANVTLAAGKWLVVFGFYFTSNATGRRVGNISTTSGDVSGARGSTESMRAVDGYGTYFNIVRILEPTSSVKYYANCLQTSGGSLACSCYITAYRLR